MHKDISITRCKGSKIIIVYYMETEKKTNRRADWINMIKVFQELKEHPGVKINLNSIKATLRKVLN